MNGAGASERRSSRDCRLCPRLARHLDAVRSAHPDYHCRPVAPFGSAGHRLLVVGLAPGKHGANRTGRPFTGDHAGILLYRTLHATGFASAAESVARSDGLRLFDCRITNAVKCLPPGNKPLPDEVRRCNRYPRATNSTGCRPALSWSRWARSPMRRVLARPGRAAFGFPVRARRRAPARRAASGSSIPITAAA